VFRGPPKRCWIDCWVFAQTTGSFLFEPPGRPAVSFAASTVGIQNDLATGSTCKFDRDRIQSPTL